jgi:hypothetical protein
LLKNFLLLNIYETIRCGNAPNFWTRDIIKGTSYCVYTELKAEGVYSKVYREKTLTETSLNYSDIASQFDSKIHDLLTPAFGDASFLPKSGNKISIVVLDIQDGATESSAYVSGFFDPVNTSTDDASSRLRSNQMDILYMDGKELVLSLSKDPNAFLSTLAHEYQHLVRYPHMDKSSLDESWINEGTSEVASDIAGYGPQISRTRCFTGTSPSSCTNGIRGVSLVNWATLDTSDRTYTLKQYAMAYVFMRFLYENSGTNLTERNAFLRKTALGSSGVRAISSDNLIQLFATTTKGSALLGSTSSNEEKFMKIFTYFGGLQTYTDYSTAVATNPTYRSSTQATCTVKKDGFCFTSAGAVMARTNYNSSQNLNLSTYTSLTPVTDAQKNFSTDTSCPALTIRTTMVIPKSPCYPNDYALSVYSTDYFVSYSSGTNSTGMIFASYQSGSTKSTKSKLDEEFEAEEKELTRVQKVNSIKELSSDVGGICGHSLIPHESIPESRSLYR